MRNKKYHSTIALLCVLFSGSTLALSAATVNTIQGSKPYLLKDGVKITDTNILLGIKLSDGTTYDITHSTDEEITLPSASDTLANVMAAVTANGGTTALSTLMSTYATDDNGDGYDATRSSATGTIAAVWTDNTGATVSDLTAKPNICLAPYTLTITTTGTLTIYTTYGDPDQSDPYTATTKQYKINPKSDPTVCYAQPNMTYSSGLYASGSTAWDTTYGFQVWKSSTMFPTTGFHGGEFNLIIKGTDFDASKYFWTTAVNGPITATPSVKDAKTVHVKITGSKGAVYSGAIGNYDDYSPIKNASSSTAMTISNGASINYTFYLKKWFLPLTDTTRANSSPTITSLCTLSKNVSPSGTFTATNKSDLTNAASEGSTSFPTDSPFHREIGGGLLSEWGGN